MVKTYQTFAPCSVSDHEEEVDEGDDDLRMRQECLRRRVTYFFMNPLQKFQVKRKLPFKIIITFFIVILMTLQLFTFETHNYNYTQEHRDTERTLRNIFLKGWDNGAEDYTVFTIPDFYENLDYVVQMFGQFGNLNLGAFGYDSPNGTLTSLNLCKTYFEKGHIFPHNNTINIEGDPVEECFEIPPLFPTGDPRWSNFSTEEFLDSANKSLDFSRLLSARLSFHLKLIILMADNSHSYCYRLLVEVKYKAYRHDGQIPIRLKTSAEKQTCFLQGSASVETAGYVQRQVQNFAVLALAAALSGLVLRSMYRGQALRLEVKGLFQEKYDSTLSAKDKHRFLDAWFLVVLLANGFLMTGSIIKFQIEAGTSSDSLYSVCSVLLGSGNLLTWLGLLRYLDFFPECNIVIITIRRAAMFVFRGMLAAFFIFMGYAMCGWLVLGPYHSKFRFLSTASETLYCLMYGDDMFPTYSDLETSSSLIWYFSRVYLYSFIFIFICAILSIVSAIIMDVYDTLKSRVTVCDLPRSKSLDDFLLEDDRNDNAQQLRQIYCQTNTKCFCSSCKNFSLTSLFRRSTKEWLQLP